MHLIVLCGGWPGALAAQHLLRHKNRKQEFQIVFWGTVALNIGALVLWKTAIANWRTNGCEGPASWPGRQVDNTVVCSLGIDLHQSADMNHRTRGQCVQAIAPFQDRYNAAVACLVGNLRQFLGDPMEVAVLQVHAREGI